MMRSAYLRQLLLRQMSFFDLRDDDSVVIEVWASHLQARLIYASTLLDCITEVTAYTGRMAPLPGWTQDGAIIGLQGGTSVVNSIVDQLVTSFQSTLSNKTSDDVATPIAGVWVQDWVGLRHAFDGDRLRWNWQLDLLHYPLWHAHIVDKLAKQNIRVLTYINPFFADPTDAAAHVTSFSSSSTFSSTDAGSTGDSRKDPEPVMPPKPPRNLFKEGILNRYFVASKASSEAVYVPYKLRSGSIDFHMLDITNPAAKRWMKDIIKYEILQSSQAFGYMADFGEYIPFDCVLHDTRYTGPEYHNLYPQEWAKLNQEAIEEAAKEGIIEQLGSKYRRLDTVDLVPDEKSQARELRSFDRRAVDTSSSGRSSTASEVLYFMRSAWMQSPQYTSSFWLGDQLVTWDEHDGLRSALTGMLSGGLTGHSLTHSDIGGYTMVRMLNAPLCIHACRCWLMSLDAMLAAPVARCGALSIHSFDRVTPSLD
jgi:alpha-glucosidase